MYAENPVPKLSHLRKSSYQSARSCVLVLDFLVLDTWS